MNTSISPYNCNINLFIQLPKGLGYINDLILMTLCNTVQRLGPTRDGHYNKLASSYL